MPTIGIVTVGDDLASAAELYEHVVRYSSAYIDDESGNLACIKDQDHPPAIGVNIAAQTPTDISNNFKLAKSLGASFLVTTESLGAEDPGNTGLAILSPTKGEDLEDFAKRIVAKSLKSQKIEREGEEKGGGAQCAFTKAGILHQKINLDKSLKDYSKNNKSKLIGVIGGAGPLAGAVYCSRLAAKGVPYIMLSHTTVPDKNDSIMGNKEGALSFVDYYTEDCQLLSEVVSAITIPCNTAHAKIRQLEHSIVGTGTKLLDIRDGTVDFLSDNYPMSKKVIVLGTPATIRKARLYHSKLEERGYEIVEPNDEELQEIYGAIYQVKGDVSKMGEGHIPFDLEGAKKRIMGVVNNIRKRIGGDTVPVILGCTELNIPFTVTQMAEMRLISTSLGLASNAKKHHALSCSPRLDPICKRSRSAPILGLDPQIIRPVARRAEKRVLVADDNDMGAVMEGSGKLKEPTSEPLHKKAKKVSRE